MDLRPKLLSLAVFMLFIGKAGALELGATLSNEFEFNSNARLNSAVTHSDTVHRLVLDTTIIENRKNFQADANFSISKDTYFQNLYSDETSVVAGFGLFNFDLIDSFLNWHSSYVRSQVLVDSALADTPDNRDIRSVFSSGPSINYAINDASQISFSTSYINVENSNPSVSDSERYNGELSYLYRLNSITNLTASASRGETIDPDEAEDYVNNRYSVGLHRQFSHGNMEFEYGKSYYFPKFSSDVRGNYFRFSMTRQGVLHHDLQMSYLEDVSDSSIGLLEDPVPGSEVTLESRGISVNDVVKTKQLDIEISRVLGNFIYRISGQREVATYSLAQSEERQYQLGVELQQNVSPTFNMSYSYGFDVDKYPDRPDIGVNRTSLYNLRAGYNVSDSLSLSGGVGYEIRRNELVSQEEYEDASASFAISWEIN